MADRLQKVAEGAGCSVAGKKVLRAGQKCGRRCGGTKHAPNFECGLCTHNVKYQPALTRAISMQHPLCIYLGDVLAIARHCCWSRLLQGSRELYKAAQHTRVANCYIRTSRALEQRQQRYRPGPLLCACNKGPRVALGVYSESITRRESLPRSVPHACAYVRLASR
jgi:hypothetical protein